MVTHRKRARACALGVIAAIVCWPQHAGAGNEAGVAAAVLPAARGIPPQDDARVLKVGVDVFVNERVQTDTGGKAQLLFFDGSALTIGPNSDVVLDTFVYDPEAKTGELVFSAAKGVFRVVGGKISKKRPITLKTPNAVIGIRGGIASITVGDEVTATFLFGESLQVTSNGVTSTAVRPGSRIVVPPEAPPQPPAPVSPPQMSSDLGGFEAPPEGPLEQPDVFVSDENVADSQIATLGSQLPPKQIAGTGAAPKAKPHARGGPAADGPLPPAPPDAVVADASQIQTLSQQVNGTTVVNTAGFQGRSKRGLDTQVGTLDGTALNDLQLSNISIVNNRFTATTPQGSFDLFFPGIAGDTTLSGQFGTNLSPYGEVTGEVFISDDLDIVVYELVGNGRTLIFAGVPAPESALPDTGASVYEVKEDFVLGGSRIPFIPANLGGNINTFPNVQAYIFWDDTPPGAIRAFHLPAGAIDGTGPTQRSVISLSTGEIDTDNGGRSFLRGEMRGSSRLLASSRFNIFEGGISTADVGGVDFFGASGANHFVLEGNEVDANDVGGSPGIDGGPRGGTNTFFANNPTKRIPPGAVGGPRTTKSMIGFTGGVAEEISATNTFLNAEAFRTDENDVATITVNTNAATNRVSGVLTGDSLVISGFDNLTVPFGGPGAVERSAFIDDYLFGAIESASGFGSVDASNFVDNQAYFTTHEGISFGSALPPGVVVCSCDFVTWGFWGLESTEPVGTHVDVHMATWVAGEAASAAQFATTTSATYAGTIIGTVFTGGNIYQAFGNIDLQFNISAGSVQVTSLNINNFDGGTYSLTTSPVSSGPDYTADLTGSRPGFGTLNGSLRGSFFGPGTPPANTAGDFEIYDSQSGPTYQAGGIYFGKR